MDRRSLLAITLCFLIYLGWQKLYLEPRMPKKGPNAALVTGAAPQAPQTPAQTAAAGSPQGSGSSLSAQTPGQQTQRAPQVETVSNEIGSAKVGDRGSVFVGWDLKGYNIGLTKDTAAISLANVLNENTAVGLTFDDPTYSYLADVQGTLVKTQQGVVWTYEDQNVKLSREVTPAADTYSMNLRYNAEFKAKPPARALVSVVAHSSKDDHEAQDRQLIYWNANSLDRIHIKEEVKAAESAGPSKYVGATNRYFLMAVVSDAGEPKAVARQIAPYQGQVSLAYPVAGNSLSIPVRVYFGPKDLSILRKVDPKLDNTVDFGWFTIFAYPLLSFLRWLYRFFGNYGVAIILLTLTLKILTYPLTYKSMKSMKEMAKIQPQLQRIKEKYADDKEALNREMLTLMRGHGYNPMAGCLPILIQMPIFFALYRVLYGSIELYHAPFAFWIHDLSAKDPFFVTPILLTVTMFLQQKLSPQTATDPAQQKMLQFMPVVFGAMMMTLPSGLTIYMLVNAISSIVQQFILNKKFDLKNNATPVAARAR